MKTTQTRVLSALLCLVLLLTCSLAGCGGNETTSSTPVGTPDKVLGEGAVTFYVEVTDDKGDVTTFEIHTDAPTVGEALLDLGIIKGDMEEFGIYIKEVNGVVADYDVTGTYWAFYVNGEYGMVGADSTEVEEGAVYGFKVEK